jgi:hypothetical protein
MNLIPDVGDVTPKAGAVTDFGDGAWSAYPWAVLCNVTATPLELAELGHAILVSGLAAMTENHTSVFSQ